MSFIVENGTIVNGANAFCTVSEARNFAEARGLSLPADDTALETLIVQATDFLNSFEECFQGSRSNPSEQELAFPRDGVKLYGVGVIGIPKQLKQATARLAFDAANGVDLEPTNNGQIIIKEGVGPLQVEYSDVGEFNGQTNLETTFTAALNLLRPLFDNNNSASNGGFVTNVCR